MTAVLRRYFRGRKLNTMEDVVAGKKYVYHFDHQGSTQALTDATTGAVTDRFASDAWGVPVKRTGTTSNSYWYLGNRRVSELSAGVAQTGGAALDLMRGRQLNSSASLGESVSSVGYPGAITRAPRPYVADEYWVEFAPLKEPSIERGPAVSECGSLNWSVYWRLSSKRGGSREPDEEVCGWIVQEVSLQGRVRECGSARDMDSRRSCLRSSGVRYYEAWQVMFVDSNSWGGVKMHDHINDTYRWRAPTERPTEGSWDWRGDAVFIRQPCPPPSKGNLAKYRLPFPPNPGGWVEGRGNCTARAWCDSGWTTTDLCSMHKPTGFDEPKKRAKRWTAASWKCRECAAGCEGVNCTWGYSDKSPDRSWRCPGF